MGYDGTWKVTMKTPMGAQPVTMELTTDGDVLSGSVTSPMGSADVTEGKVDGNDASWVLNMTSPMPMTLKFTATIDGDKISGNANVGPMGDAPFEGARA